MHLLQNKARHDSIREAFIKNRDIRGASSDFNNNKDVIAQARTISLIEVIRSYKIALDEHTKKINCPLPAHSNDRSPSFYLYKDTNSFYCFGCKNGGQFAGAAEFVSSMEGISVFDAAIRLVSIFSPDLDAVASSNHEYLEKQNLLIRFSTMIREYIYSNIDDENVVGRAEKFCSIFDMINGRRKMTNSGMKTVIDKLEIEIKK